MSIENGVFKCLQAEESAMSISQWQLVLYYNMDVLHSLLRGLGSLEINSHQVVCDPLL